MILYICKLFLCFITFAFLGWILEVLYGLYKLKKFVNRGFLIGPLCPIYGVSCVLLYLLFSPVKNPIVLFILSAIFCSIVEYLVSSILERVFNVRWWDYNDMKFNINGRICLEMAIPFGLLGLLSVYYLVPFTLKTISTMPNNYIYIFAIILFTLFLIDEIVSIFFTSKFEKKDDEKDNTIEVKRYIKKSLLKK